MKHYLLLFLLLFLMAAVVAAQPTAPAYATGAIPVFLEKPYLHTDRETYVAGEDIWFKAYLVGARTHRPIESSRNLYVELLSPNSEILKRITVRLDKGTGAGDFRLNDSIPFGLYRIRAYTNWMRNFGDSFVFEKELTIHSQHKSTAEVMAMETTAPAKASLEMSVTNPFRRVEPTESIQFFPEGGAMVAGVEGVVAFKAENSGGAGLKAKGSVYTSAGDTLSRFESTAMGMGCFVLLPQAGVTYHVKGVFENARPFNATLPAALSKGFVLHAAAADSATLLVTISACEASFQEHQGREFLLAGKHGNVKEVSIPFTLNAPQIQLRIAKDLLPPGVAALTLYDEQLRPHCERLVFIPQRDIVNLDITPDNAIYAPRSKVTVKLKATGIDNLPVKANLSVAAVDAGVLAANATDIASYLLLQSEIRGKIQQPGQYFDRSIKNRHQQLDLLLLTQGWRDFAWKKIADTTYTIRYLPEQGFTVSGTVRQLMRDKPLHNANITLTAFRAKGQKVFATRTGADGRYYFDGLQLYGKQTFTIITVNNNANGAGILLVDSLITEPMPVRPVPLLLTPEPAPFVATRTELLRRKDALHQYRLSDTILLRELEVKGAKVIRMRDGTTAVKAGMKDRVYVITKNDHAFETLDRFINFHIPEDRKDGNVRFYVNGRERTDYSDYQGRNFMRNPLETEPGTAYMSPQSMQNMRSDPDRYSKYMQETAYSLPMTKVKKLLLRQMVGADGKTFYILYITTTPDAFNRNLNRVVVGVDGYYQARVFYSPYTDNPAFPDERTTLFWNHTIITDENGEATITFYNADPATKIRIVAEGITEKGVPVAGTAVYEVK